MNFLERIAEAIGTKTNGSTITIPSQIGEGFISGLVIDEHLTLLIRQYELRKAFKSMKKLSAYDGHHIVIAFHHIYSVAERNQKKLNQKEVVKTYRVPVAQISTVSIQHEIFIPANEKMSSLIITITKDYFNRLFCDYDHELFRSMSSIPNAFLYEEVISPELVQIAADIIAVEDSVPFKNFYLKIQVEKLIYLLFSGLTKRENPSVHSINIADIRSLYEVKDTILDNLNIYPQIAHLARLSGMSESKLSRLFKQVFGKSVYNYYQAFKMKEASIMLRSGKYTVTEVGLKLGYSNLSHFTKLFEKHIGIKPKRFSIQTYNGIFKPNYSTPRS